MRGHEIVAYDQFTWLGEDYWTPLMDDMLVQKLGLVKDSPEYIDGLFALIKPREISTTLEEKREVIRKALYVRTKKQTIEKSAEELAKEFGWMPVLAFGQAWDAKHYVQELEETMRREEKDLQKEFSELERYSELRDEAFDRIVTRYKITSDDAQLFVDYGLAIDARNEAEYVASFIGGYLMPVFEEARKRLGLSMTELRTLFRAGGHRMPQGGG